VVLVLFKENALNIKNYELGHIKICKENFYLLWINFSFSFPTKLFAESNFIKDKSSLRILEFICFTSNDFTASDSLN